MKVIHAVLPTGQLVHHPSWGQSLKGTINETSYRGISMFLVEQGVRITYKEKVMLVPMSKFDCVELENPNAKKTTK